MGEKPLITGAFAWMIPFILSRITKDRKKKLEKRKRNFTDIL
jgi:hypothetical protein